MFRSLCCAVRAVWETPKSAKQIRARARIGFDWLEARDLKTCAFGLVVDLPEGANESVLVAPPIAEQHALVDSDQQRQNVENGGDVDSAITPSTAFASTAATDAVFAGYDGAQDASVDAFEEPETSASELTKKSDNTIAPDGSKKSVKASGNEMMGMIMMTMQMPQASMSNGSQMAGAASMSAMPMVEKPVAVEPMSTESPMLEMPMVIVIYRDNPEENQDDEEYFDPEADYGILELWGLPRPEREALKGDPEDTSDKGAVNEKPTPVRPEDSVQPEIDEKPLLTPDSYEQRSNREGDNHHVDEHSQSPSDELGLLGYSERQIFRGPTWQSSLSGVVSGALSIAATLLLCVISTGTSIV